MRPLDWHDAQFQRLAAGSGRRPHALLLHGPKGIGKLVFARALAQVMLCEAPARSEVACGRCRACTWFEGGFHPDYRQIEPAPAESEGAEEGEKKAHISVDQVRVLPEFINISSHRGGVRVIVVHPAEALNINAANALLKNLEEPPPGTHFILVAHRPHQLLPTIRSRCQQIALKAPSVVTATAWLESQGMRNAALALAHVGDAPLLALELNASEYWGARSAFLRHLTAENVDVLAAGEAVRDFPVPHVIAWLQKWSYDMVHCRAVGRVRYNPDCLNAIAHAAAAADPVATHRFHRDMVALERVAQHPLNPRLFIEHVLLAYRDVLRAAAHPL